VFLINNSLFGVCLAHGKSQKTFLAFALLTASLKKLFWRLPCSRQVLKNFFGVCLVHGKSQY
jgi:hypothetical protein